jgi:hypothetical protein
VATSSGRFARVPNGTDAFTATSHTVQAVSPSSRRRGKIRGRGDAERTRWPLHVPVAFTNGVMEYWMTSWLWLLPPFIGLAIWVFRDARGRGPDLGSVSAQWLHEYRQTHQDG